MHALTGARIVTTHAVLDDHAVVIEGASIRAVVPERDLSAGTMVERLDGGWLLPGFIDTQVNGGGDVLLNDAPDVDGVAAIAAAHRRFGTTGLLPTLISDDADVVARAIDAVDQAIAQGVPGVLGIHLEGPFLNPAKRGIHDAGRFRRLDADGVSLLTRPGRGVRVATVAPECADPGAIAALTKAGVIVAAAHSAASYEQTRAAIGEGLSGFTHLFNAMTGLESRAPGMVGAALEDRGTRFGIIVDGHHVAPAALRVALAARGVGAAMLVTDAMPPVGGTRDLFTLMGREIRVVDGTCRAADGTLGGAALSMAEAVRNALDWLGVDWPGVARMASTTPAAFLGLRAQRGAITAGLAADLVHLDATRRVRSTWIAGNRSTLGED